MANGIQVIPTLDRFAGLRAGAQNLVGGLNQQFQQGQQVSDLQKALQFIQARQQGQNPGIPQFDTTQGASLVSNFLGQQPSAAEQQQAAANLALTQARTKELVDPNTLTVDEQKRADLIAAGLQPRVISKLEQDETKSIIAKNRAESERLRREGGGTLTPEQLSAQTTVFRKEFDALSKDFRVSRDSFNRVIASADDPSAAGDLALIFNFMKVLDPGSVVRESEFANAAASGAFGERVKAAAAKIFSGERLSPVVRADFVNRAGKLFAAQEKTQKSLIGRYTGLSKRFKVDPQDVITDFSLQTDQAPEGDSLKDVLRQNLGGQTGFSGGPAITTPGDGTARGDTIQMLAQDSRVINVPKTSIKQMLDRGFRIPQATSVRTATNPGTNERMISFDGGRTWQKL
jgi:hypothetical protein